MRVHDSQAHRKMDVTMERISRVLELREILLSFQTGFNLANAVVEHINTVHLQCHVNTLVDYINTSNAPAQEKSVKSVYSFIAVS